MGLGAVCQCLMVSGVTDLPSGVAVQWRIKYLKDFLMGLDLGLLMGLVLDLVQDLDLVLILDLVCWT